MVSVIRGDDNFDSSDKAAASAQSIRDERDHQQAGFPLNVVWPEKPV